MAKTARGSQDPLNDLVLSIFRLNGFFLDAAERKTQESWGSSEASEASAA